MSNDPITNYWPLRDIEVMLRINSNVDPKPSLSQLETWAEKHEKNEFPLPAKTIGRFKFYDIEEVTEWVILWHRATRHMGNRKGLKNNG